MYIPSASRQRRSISASQTQLTDISEVDDHTHTTSHLLQRNRSNPDIVLDHQHGMRVESETGEVSENERDVSYV